MTRDGLTFLVKGFTGPKAAHFFEKYIEKFNAMEAQLHAPAPLADEELMARALLEAHKTLDELTHKVEELEPKARALDTLSAAEGTRCVTTAWKELSAVFGARKPLRRRAAKDALRNFKDLAR